MSQGLQPPMEGCAIVQVGWEVIVGVIVHDGMSDLRPNGAGGRHLRRELGARFGKICHQGSIDGLKWGGTVEFEFKRRYKTLRASQKTTLGHLSIVQLSRAQSVENQVIIEPLSLRETKYCVGMITTTKDGLGIEEGIVMRSCRLPWYRIFAKALGS